jgi:dipeptidyl aminopeptidase/acylaminoacyl peptidase
MQQKIYPTQLRGWGMLAAIMLLAATVWAQGWTPAYMIQYKRVGGTAISNDGRLIAYTVGVPQMDGDKSEYLTHVWLVKSDGSGTPWQLTQGEKSCTSPAFSPDGRYVSFLSARDKDGKTQLYLLPLAGGEGIPLTKSKVSIAGYSWSPDGKKIALWMSDAATDKEEKDQKEKRDWKFIDNNYKMTHIHVLSVPDNPMGPVAVKRLTGGSFHVTGMNWSPDSKTIAFNHQTNPSANEWPTTDISTVPADSGAVRLLVNGKGQDYVPTYTPDGQNLVYLSDGGDPHWPGVSEVYVMPAAGGPARKLAATPDQRAGDILGFSADGKEAYVSEAHKTQAAVFAVPLDGKPARKLWTNTGMYANVAITRNGAMAALTYMTPELPPDVYSVAMNGGTPKKLTDHHKDYLKHPMGKTEIITWKSKDGKYDIEGLLTYPVGYKAGQKVPFILNVHGGPAGVFNQVFTATSAVYPLQAFAQAGYAVLRPNPRGSSGYGKEFRFANINDWGGNDYDDLMTGVDKVIAMGIAHPDSLCVTGWSYGGYMTSTIVTKTNRFKAAMVGAGVTNLISFTGTADIPAFIPDYFGGEFWNREEVWRSHSAMFSIKNVKTPSLVIHGEADPRVPVSQGYEFYTALKRLGVKTEMYVYPRQPHGFTEPKFIQDVGERVIGWFNKQLGRK